MYSSNIVLIQFNPFAVDAVAEKEFTQNQTKLKLSAVKSRINKLKKDVTFRG